MHEATCQYHSKNLPDLDDGPNDDEDDSSSEDEEGARKRSKVRSLRNMPSGLNRLNMSVNEA